MPDETTLTVNGEIVYSTNTATLFNGLTRLEALITVLGDRIMATFTEVMDKVSAINVSLTNIRADVQSLKAQVAAGGPVTQAQLDSLDTALTNMATDAASIDTETPPAP